MKGGRKEEGGKSTKTKKESEISNAEIGRRKEERGKKKDEVARKKSAMIIHVHI